MEGSRVCPDEGIQLIEVQKYRLDQVFHPQILRRYT